MDVCSLYTSIPNDEGLAALRYFLDRRSNQTPSTTTIVRLTELVLKLNHFVLNGEHYLQVKGVAMGSKIGPGYACIRVGHFEEQLFASYSGPKPVLYKRYIDDIVGLGTHADLDHFVNYVANFDPTLKFTWNISDTSIDFLDVTISINDHGLSTTIFYKPTDSHNYLRSSSHLQALNSLCPITTPSEDLQRGG